MNRTPRISIATVLLEPNRWDSRRPSFNVSDWQARFADAGFDGIELWENHLLFADNAERDAVASGPLPVAVLNTYCGFDREGREARAASAALARRLNVPAVKFNLGDDPHQEREYIDNLRAWRGELPKGCRMLCECHGGTILEEPASAARILEPLRGEVGIIVHAFAGDDSRGLKQAIDAFGGAIEHVHVWLRNRSVVPGRIEMLRSAGFDGTWTIEFCAGVNEPPEDMDALFRTACEDMEYLRRSLT